jgi:hypothetical protein
MDLKVNLPKGTGQTVKVAVIAQGNELLFLFLFHLYQSQIMSQRYSKFCLISCVLVNNECLNTPCALKEVR